MSYEGLSKFLDFRSLPDPGSRFTLEDVIATGTYAEVRQALDTENGNRKVAIKMIDSIKENLEEVEEEHRIFSELSSHDNFPAFYGAFLKKANNWNEHQIWFVMEYMSEGSVSDLARMYIKNEERMSEMLIGYILREVIKAVMHLHAAHIMHRDIKGMNILVTEEGKIKLVDFGQCAHLSETMEKRNTAVGTPYWMAPEVIECEQKQDHSYDNRADVWAIGITAIELADGDPPYADIHPVRALFQILRNPPPLLKRASDWSQDLVDFIAECLVKTADHRPVILEIIEHPFIVNVPEDASEIRKKLLDERKRLLAMNVKPERPMTAIARQGYLKTDRHGAAKKMIVDDLAALESFNDEVVLENLFGRYQDGYIYTWVADVLLAVNPFSDRCKYDVDVQKKYKSKSRNQNDPHIFAVADRAHQDMMHHKEHQTIVLSGESGSGKTYNFNQVVNQLCYIGSSNPGLIEKIKKVSVILDAFGNAVTQLNPNATRHVRYFDITFNKTGKASGAIIWLFMLDKFRVTERARGEGNFHMFYYLYDGLSQSSRLARYGLKLGRKYHYLAKHPFDNEVTNAQKFNKVEEAFKEIGFTDRELHTVYLVLAAILNIGNISITGDQNASIVDMEPVKEVCHLLDVDEKKLTWALCNYCDVKAGKQVEQVKKTEYEAEMSKDALARTLYSRLVDYVVNTINTRLSVTRLVFGDPYAIGILDMFGFEANDHNSFENLLVNVANEQVQYFYNQYIFNWEMQDYSAEGIPVKNFTFPDNRHILELFLAKNSGLFAVVEEESRDKMGTDSSLACKLKQRQNQKQMQQVSEFTFAISHYVGRVKYDFHGLINKNRDHISVELIQTMRKSANDHIRAMFCNKLTKTGNVTIESEELAKKKKAAAATKKTDKKESRRFNTKSRGQLSQTRHVQTWGMTFRYSLIELLYKLTNSQPHFVRCIRSNMDNSESVFDRDMIKHQVKYHAVCDTIRIRQQGFSHRIPYQEFLRRYQFLAFEFDEVVDLTKDNARLLLVRLKMEGWAIGKDKVFLKFYNEEFLSRLYETSVKKIVKIQALMRAYMQRKKKLKGPQRAEENFRGYKTRQEHPEIAEKIRNREKYGEATIEGEAARYVQYYFRKWKMRTLFQQLQIYRADKQQHLIYFSQQVHLYSQELQSKMQRLNFTANLSQVRNEVVGAHKTIMIRAPPPVPKLALDHMITAYFDTTFLCDPSRAKKGRQQDDDWEAPFKSRAAATRAANMGLDDPSVSAKAGGGGGGGVVGARDTAYTPMDVRSRTAMFSQGGPQADYSYSEPATGASSYNRFAGSSTPRVAPTYNKFAGAKSSYVPPTQSYLKPTAPKTPVVVNSWNDRHNGYSDNNYDDESQGTHDFRKHLRKTNRSAILEMEARAAGAASDEGSFNFQDTARKFGDKGGAKPRISPVQPRKVSPAVKELQDLAQRDGGDGYTPSDFQVSPAVNERQELAQRDDWDGDTPSDFQVSPAVKELQELALRDGGDGDTPSDFQGMLRKTGHSRQSMKRGEGDDYRNGGGSVTPTFTEETEEAML
ncbi:neither inactivation nor afterpotential protein C isoform X2 [Palaemon carinicauda]|uniref:neither inactivation nor afterpotential protein C isoform X2 n=1 Tax=Palaemon carinicauda TaxID=392227 RepID=UPI0035B6269C